MPEQINAELDRATMAYYCTIAQRVEDFRIASMDHYQRFWESVKLLPTEAKLDQLKKEMDRQLQASGVQHFNF
jgi:hypothetical protein